MLIQLTWSSPASAWILDGHRLIALDALTALPPPMREVFTRHLSALLGGVVEPDVNRVVSHKIPIVSLRETRPPPRSGAANEFKRLAANAQEMLRLGPGQYEAGYVSEMTIRLGGMDDVLFVLGQATHFVQDLDQPLHAAWGETRAEHHEVEEQMLYRSWHEEHTYRGFQLVKDYSCFAYELPRSHRSMPRHSSLTGTSGESLRAGGIRPSMTRPISGSRSLCTRWARSRHGRSTASRRRSRRSEMDRAVDPWYRRLPIHTRPVVTWPNRLPAPPTQRSCRRNSADFPRAPFLYSAIDPKLRQRRRVAMSPDVGWITVQLIYADGGADTQLPLEIQRG